MQVIAESELYDEAVGPRPEPTVHPGRIQEMPDKPKGAPIYYRADHQRRCPNVPSASEWRQNVRRRRMPDRIDGRTTRFQRPLLVLTETPPVFRQQPQRRESSPRPPSRLSIAVADWEKAKRDHAAAAEALTHAKKRQAEAPDDERVAMLVFFIRTQCLKLADAMIEKRNEVRRQGGVAR